MKSKSIHSGARQHTGRQVLASVLSLLCLAAAPAAFAQSSTQKLLREGPLYHAVPTAASHQAQVVVFRGAAPDAAPGQRGLGAHVYVDGEFHTSLLSNGWTRLCVAPGDRSIEAYVGDAPRYAGKAEPKTRVNLESGKTYFAGVSEQGAVELRPFNRAEAEGLLQGKREQRHVVSRASAVERCEEGPAAPVAPAAVEPKSFTLSSDALFAFGKSDYAAMRPEGRAELVRIASEIKTGSLDSVAVQVRGHADPIGSAASNLRLSEQRARTVSRILAEQGIPANRIASEGVGSAEPVVSCKATGSKEARVACNVPNRRVEVIARGAK